MKQQNSNPNLIVETLMASFKYFLLALLATNLIWIAAVRLNSTPNRIGDTRVEINQTGRDIDQHIG